MYEAHQVCESPRDQNSLLWRYMDFTKLVEILEMKSLFFPRIAVFEDPLEGYVSPATIGQTQQEIQSVEGVEREKQERTLKHNLRVFKSTRDNLYASSWHMNEYESAAMWRLYLKSSEGIAIQTTFDRLRESFRVAPQIVHIGMIKYFDPRKEVTPWDNMLHLGLHKRKSFEHEREVRALVFETIPPQPGIHVPVVLDVLVDQVYIAPKSESWLRELTQQVLKRYGLDREVRQSDLMSEPPY